MAACNLPARFTLLRLVNGLRVSEACDLRWDDIDLGKRTIVIRRLKGSTDSSHYLERDEHKALGDLWRANAAKGIKSSYVFVNERGQPFGRMGIGRMIERAGEAAGLPFPVHVHMLRQTGSSARSSISARSVRSADGSFNALSLGPSPSTNTTRCPSACGTMPGGSKPSPPTAASLRTVNFGQGQKSWRRRTSGSWHGLRITDSYAAPA